MKQVPILHIPQRYTFLRVLLWVCVFSLLLLLVVVVTSIAVSSAEIMYSYGRYAPIQVLGTFATTLLFYFSLNYFHHLFRQRKKFRSFVVPVVLGIVAVEVYNLCIDSVRPLFGDHEVNLSLVSLLLGYLLIAVPNMAVALLITYINHLRDERRRHRLLEEQKLKLEVEKSQAEVKFLKSQINPHFLHNTLNSLYARSLPLSADLADGVLTLSSVMRYAFDETGSTGGKVLLKDEIEHVQNGIKINQFRFRNHLNVQLEIKGEVNEQRIIPFVLITLVENIFKHGELNDPAFPVTVVIEAVDNGLRYYSTNRKKQGPKELSTGVGLDNIQKRLELTYGSNYELHVKDEAETYTTELIIHSL
jgi:two-component system LytT family sensor kinase